METHEERIDEVLRRWWGFDSFRPVQEQIVRAAMGGRDTLALIARPEAASRSPTRFRRSARGGAVHRRHAVYIRP